MLDRETILNKSELKRQKVAVPEWGGEVIVSEMTGAGRDEWELSILSREGKQSLVNSRAKLVIATVVNENGEKLFTADDIDRVSNLSAAALDRICRIAQELNGLTTKELEEAKKD